MAKKKKNKRLAKVDIRYVHVEWVDSNSWNGWRGGLAIKDEAINETLKCESVGLLIEESEDRIVMASSLSFSMDFVTQKELFQNLNGVMAIPKCSIKSIHYLKWGKKKKVGNDQD